MTRFDTQVPCGDCGTWIADRDAHRQWHKDVDELAERLLVVERFTLEDDE